jgi:CheY-like chemotaxis protein
MNPDDLAAADSPAGPDAPPTILNVNDDDLNRFALTRILRSRGFRVEEARDGAGALCRVADARPDLVLLDVHLPDIDGFEVCRRIKAAPETMAIPVLHLSAQYVLEEDRTHGLVSGADGYLIQPVEPLELIASIRGLLRMRDAEAAARLSALRVEQLESELKALERVVAATTPAAAPDPQFRPLRDEHPGAFGELTSRCEALLDLALERQRYKVEHDLGAALQEMGQRLGALGAGPRDVIEIYGAALKSRTGGTPAARARAYVDEGRMLVLELMGHMVSYYRSRCPASGPASPG